MVRHDGVGEQRHVAAALDGGGHLALVLGAVSRDAPGNDLPALGDEVLEVGGVLVVDLQLVVGAVAADLAPAESAAAALHVAAASVSAVAPVLAPAASAASARGTAPASRAGAIAERHLLLRVVHVGSLLRLGRNLCVE